MLTMSSTYRTIYLAQYVQYFIARLEQLGLAISARPKRAIFYPTLNNESLLEAIFASIVSCIPDSDDMNSFPGVVSV